MSMVEGSPLGVLTDDSSIEAFVIEGAHRHGFSSCPVDRVVNDALESIGNVEGLQSFVDVEV